MNIGNILHEMRTKRNLTIIQVHKATGIGIGTLSEYENNLTTPSLERFMILCDFYRVNAFFAAIGREVIDITDYSSKGRKIALENDLREKKLNKSSNQVALLYKKTKNHHNKS